MLKTLPLKQLTSHLLHVLLPARCIACGVEVAVPGSVCAACWKTLHFISSNACICCGHPFETPTPIGTLCGACIAEEPPYLHARAALHYDAASSPLITHFKYADGLNGTETFVRWMLAAGTDALKNADVIIPVPLHRLRLLKRRYNQSALLANALGKQCGLPVLRHALIRKRFTEAQAGLSKSARLDNVKGAFHIVKHRKEQIKGRHVVLVDDVMTTGATVQECSRVLLKNGAASVRILTLARTVLGS